MAFDEYGNWTDEEQEEQGVAPSNFGAMFDGLNNSAAIDALLKPDPLGDSSATQTGKALTKSSYKSLIGAQVPDPNSYYSGEEKTVSQGLNSIAEQQMALDTKLKELTLAGGKEEDKVGRYVAQALLAFTPVVGGYLLGGNKLAAAGGVLGAKASETFEKTKDARELQRQMSFQSKVTAINEAKFELNKEARSLATNQLNFERGDAAAERRQQSGQEATRDNILLKNSLGSGEASTGRNRAVTDQDFATFGNIVLDSLPKELQTQEKAKEIGERLSTAQSRGELEDTAKMIIGNSRAMDSGRDAPMDSIERALMVERFVVLGVDRDRAMGLLNENVTRREAGNLLDQDRKLAAQQNKFGQNLVAGYQAKPGSNKQVLSTEQAKTFTNLISTQKRLSVLLANYRTLIERDGVNFFGESGALQKRAFAQLTLVKKEAENLGAALSGAEKPLLFDSIAPTSDLWTYTVASLMGKTDRSTVLTLLDQAESDVSGYTGILADSLGLMRIPENRGVGGEVGGGANPNRRQALIDNIAGR